MEQIVIGAAAVKGEDCTSKFVNEVAGTKGVVLADGLGSCMKAKETAEFIVNELCQELEAVTVMQAELVSEIFPRVHRRLLDWIAEDAVRQSDTLTESKIYGSTLMVAIETVDRFILAYVGNGAIWHIRGNAFHNHGNRLLPWSVTNLLNPHTVPQDGVEALYKYFSGSEDASLVQPTVLELSKDNLYGDVLFLCTDGISSNDQVGIGRVESGVWVNVEDSLLQFMMLLQGFLNANPAERNLDRLKDEYLEWLLAPGQIEDDASFGILVSIPNEQMP